jgi:hypothetical protein
MKTDQEYREIKERAQTFLFKIPGVHGVAIGGKTKDGKLTGERAIRIFVFKKKALEEVPPAERIPPEIEGVKTDVEESSMPKLIKKLPGVYTYLNDKARCRPLKGGVQIKVEGQGRGTLGCFCTVKGDPSKVIGITCHHVIYSDKKIGETAIWGYSAEVGQPEPEDSCSHCCSSLIGKVINSYWDQVVDGLDVALIQLNAGMQWLAEVKDVGRITGKWKEIDQDEADAQTYQVKKRGWKTGLAGGTIIDMNYTSSQDAEDPIVNAIRIKANPDQFGVELGLMFCNFGDSGSVVLNDANEVVGLLTHGNKEDLRYGYATPIDRIIEKFEGLPEDRRISLEIAVAGHDSDVQTVPGAAMVGLAQEDRLGEAITGEAAGRLEQEIGASRLGRWYAELYRRHFNEVNGLINGNRRVGAIWRQSGGAALFQSLMRAFQAPDYRVPQTINGAPLHQCLDRFLESLVKYGSAALGADLRQVRPTLPDIAGLAYREILHKLAEPEGISAPATA